jgi:hypothetical protein
MWKRGLFAAPFVLWTLLVPAARADQFNYSSNGSGMATPYLGQVATRSSTPDSFASSLKQEQSRSTHFARTNISALQIVVPNFYVTGSGPETGSGSAGTVTASLEYPSGTCTQIKFSGSASGTVPNDGLLLSDALSIAIPNGAQFFVRMHLSFPSGAVYESTTGAGMMATDGLVVSTTTTPDLTLTCGPVAQGYTVGFFPAAIIGQTTRPSVLLAGDSRIWGQQDTADAYGDIGGIARSIGPALAYINVAAPGDAVGEAVVSYANRLALSAYTTHVISAYGINDISGGNSAATIVTNTNTFISFFSGKPVWVTTLPPETTSSDTWATPTRTAPSSPNNQTLSSFNSVRVTYNTDVRSGTSIVGARGYIDLASLVESGWNSGYWIGPNCTPDGVHESVVCTLLEQAAGVVPVGSITR